MKIDLFGKELTYMQSRVFNFRYQRDYLFVAGT